MRGGALARWSSTAALLAWGCDGLKAPDDEPAGTGSPQLEASVAADGATDSRPSCDFEGVNGCGADETDELDGANVVDIVQPELKLAPSWMFGAITEFVAPFSLVSATEIISGPDGALWIPIPTTGTILRMTTDGLTAAYRLPTMVDSGRDPTHPRSLIVGPDNNLWFESHPDTTFSPLPGPPQLLRMTLEGAVSSFVLPMYFQPGDLVAGSDGNIWFVDANDFGVIHRMSLDGRTSDIPLTGMSTAQISSLAAGADGNLWFTEAAAPAIGRLTTGGEVTEFALPSSHGRAQSITTGGASDLWFVYERRDSVGRITLDGSISDFALLNDAATGIRGIQAVTSGPGGKIWISDTGESGQNLGGIESMSADGTNFVKIPCPDSCTPLGIAAGSDGMVWYVDPSRNVIARLAP